MRAVPIAIALALAAAGCLAPRPGCAQTLFGPDAWSSSAPSHLPIWEWELPGPPNSTWPLYIGTVRSELTPSLAAASHLQPLNLWSEPFHLPAFLAELQFDDMSRPLDIAPPDEIDALPAPADSPVVLYSVTTEGIMGATYRDQFWRGWTFITGIEVSILAITMMVPKDWTGWHDDFIESGLSNIERAWTNPPVMDGDHWFHNYVGHPYGGNVYYNTVRSQGATPAQSFFFSALLSAQWEYAFEAVAEQPSIQDLIITPTTGSVLGEIVHRMTLAMKKNGTSVFEKAFILLANPTHVVMEGWN